MTAYELAGWMHGTDSPKQSWVNQVNRNCADGTIVHCAKVGRNWHINVSREYPELFAAEAAADADPLEAFANALIAAGQALLRGAKHEQGEGGAA